MADLEALRDHARRMAAMTEPETETADHEPGCWLSGTGWAVHPCDACRCPRLRVVAEPPTDAERVIWRRLADELDAWLDGGDGQEVLL